MDDERRPDGGDEPDPLTSGDPLGPGGGAPSEPGPADKGPALPDEPPADKGPALPDEEPAEPIGPFTGGSAAPFGGAMQDEPAPPPPPVEPPAPPAAGPGGWVPEGAEPPAPAAPPPAEPPAAPAGPGGWIPEDTPVYGGPQPAEPAPPAPPPPPSEPVAPSTPSPEPPSTPGMEEAPPTGLRAGDPLAASEPAPSGFPAPPAAPGATGEETVPRAEGSVPPPGYTPGAAGYGGGPVPPGAYAPPAPAPQPIGDYQLASWGSRAVALIIDSLIVGVASLIFIIVIGAIFGSLGSLGGDSGGAIGFVLGVFFALLPVLVVSLLYKPYWMSKNNGQTIGKQAMNIRVIRVNGQPTDLGWSALREVVVIQGLFGFIGGAFLLGIPILIDYLWPLWDEENRALHDMLVQSRVVKA